MQFLFEEDDEVLLSNCCITISMQTDTLDIFLLDFRMYHLPIENCVSEDDLCILIVVLLKMDIRVLSLLEQLVFEILLDVF